MRRLALPTLPVLAASAPGMRSATCSCVGIASRKRSESSGLIAQPAAKEPKTREVRSRLAKRTVRMWRPPWWVGAGYFKVRAKLVHGKNAEIPVLREPTFVNSGSRSQFVAGGGAFRRHVRRNRWHRRCSRRKREHTHSRGGRRFRRRARVHDAELRGRPP